MNREELIKEFDKQQLEILLNDLQDIDKFTGFKDGAFKYELGKYQANLLVNCIKKQKEVIDEAIKYIESKNNGHCIINGEEKGAFTFILNFDAGREFIWKLLDILKEVE